MVEIYTNARNQRVAQDKNLLWRMVNSAGEPKGSFADSPFKDGRDAVPETVQSSSDAIEAIKTYVASLHVEVGHIGDDVTHIKTALADISVNVGTIKDGLDHPQFDFVGWHSWLEKSLDLLNSLVGKVGHPSLENESKQLTHLFTEMDDLRTTILNRLAQQEALQEQIARLTAEVGAKTAEVEEAKVVLAQAQDVIVRLGGELDQEKIAHQATLKNTADPAALKIANDNLADANAAKDVAEHERDEKIGQLNAVNAQLEQERMRGRGPVAQWFARRPRMHGAASALTSLAAVVLFMLAFVGTNSLLYPLQPQVIQTVDQTALKKAQDEVTEAKSAADLATAKMDALALQLSDKKAELAAKNKEVEDLNNKLTTAQSVSAVPSSVEPTPPATLPPAAPQTQTSAAAGDLRCGSDGSIFVKQLGRCVFADK